MQTERANFTFRADRMTYTEVWRHSPSLIGMALLLTSKCLRRSTFDRKHTMVFAPAISVSPNVPQEFTSAFEEASFAFEKEGFRFVGVDMSGSYIGLYYAYYLKDEALGCAMLSKRLRYEFLLSFPEASRPYATANGHTYLDYRPLYISEELPRNASIAALTQRHFSRVAKLALPSLLDTEVPVRLEGIARSAYAFNVARGLYNPTEPNQTPEPTPPSGVAHL